MPRSGQQQDESRPAPRLRRAYYDCRFGQLHLHNAIPAGGGFDELTPVICLHDAGETGAAFLPILAALGAARSVYALDLPGAGASDPAPGVADPVAALQAVGDFVDNMRIRAFDLIARGAACPVALEVVRQRGAAVRRALLLDAPAASPASTLTAKTARSSLPGAHPDSSSHPQTAHVIRLSSLDAVPARLVTLLAPQP